jgi:hypothetical protein
MIQNNKSNQLGQYFSQVDLCVISIRKVLFWM